MTDTFSSAYSRYYDLLYRDKDYVAEANYIAGLLDRYGINGKEVLEFGSGTGIHGCLLAECGYRVTGIERSAEMIRRAKTVPGFTCQQGDICTVQLDMSYDAVISLFHVLSYQVTNEALLLAFTCAADHLTSGGLFVFDVWYSPGVYAQKPEVRLKHMEGDGIDITRVAEPVLYPNENRVDVKYTIFLRETSSGAMQSFKELHSMRHFSIPELEFLAKISGFEIIGSEEFLTGNVPSENTWGVCFILRKLV